MKKFGVSSAEWEARFEAQGRRCACCGSSEPGAKYGWSTDHDHSRPDKNIRGILDHRCNRLLGMLGDCVEGVRRNAAMFARYLAGYEPGIGAGLV